MDIQFQLEDAERILSQLATQVEVIDLGSAVGDPAPVLIVGVDSALDLLPELEARLLNIRQHYVGCALVATPKAGA